ncbi:MAG TPA: phosphodiester glycosidase family protein [Acholeplasma sp.]|nr:phosphodiester glycosidase family protein [Acholeplasma sp.]
MKNWKRIIGLLTVLSFVLVFIVVLLPAREVQAIDTAYTDSGDAGKTGTYKVNEVKEINYMPYGLVHYRHIGESTSTTMVGKDVDGYQGSNDTVKAGQYYAQHVNVLEVPSTTGIKIIPWMNYTGNKWNLTTVRNFIEDFEAKNPEWHVMAAVNGDGFDIGRNLAFPAQSNGATISEGNFFKSKSSGWGIMRFIRDGRQDISNFAYLDANQVNNSLITVVDIYDENDNIIARYNIEHHNKAPNVGETSIYYGVFTNQPNAYTFYPKEVDSNASFFGVAEAEIWLPNDTEGDFYGKGIISTTDKSSLSTLQKEQFAICTMNSDLKAALAIGTKVRVQRVYSGEFAYVENALSVFGARVMEDGVALGFEPGQRFPRTFIGVKPDGTNCFIVVDGRNGDEGRHGLDGYEMGALLRRYGCVRGYNLDGGGSVTMIIREPDGSLSCKNYPSDGFERTDGNCVLIAVKRPEIEIETKPEIRKIDLKVNLNDNAGHDMQKLFISLNNEKKEVIDGKATFERLQPGTNYEYALSYEDSNSLTFNLEQKGVAQTAYVKPELNGIKCTESSDKFEFVINYRDSNNISNYGIAPIKINGKAYNFTEGSLTVLKSDVGEKIETCVVDLEYKFTPSITYKRSLNNAHLSFALVFENMYANLEDLIKEIY